MNNVPPQVYADFLRLLADLQDVGAPWDRKFAAQLRNFAPSSNDPSRSQATAGSGEFRLLTLADCSGRIHATSLNETPGAMHDAQDLKLPARLHPSRLLSSPF